MTLDADRVSAPLAIVDIGGRTTDYVVVQDQDEEGYWEM